MNNATWRIYLNTVIDAKLAGKTLDGTVVLGGGAVSEDTEKAESTESPQETYDTQIVMESSGGTGTSQAADGDYLIATIRLGAAFLIGVLLTLIIVELVRICKKKPEKAAESAEGNGRQEIVLSVGKLHQLGARGSQQDCFSVSDLGAVDTHGLLAVVADGMGGLADGDRISELAVTTIMENFYRIQGDPQRILMVLLENANQAVNKFLGESNLRKSGSTLVAGLIRDNAFYYISVGDSRICLYRDGKIYQLNREHIYYNELSLKAVNHEGSWEEADTHPRAHGLTSFLGMGTLKHVDIPATPIPIQAGDRFVLMSDGVYNALSSQELLELLGKPAQDAADAITALIAGKQNTGQDNYTAIILEC